MNKIRSVEWDEICPWLILFRTFRIAASARCLILATLGVLLGTFITWAMLPSVQGTDACPIIEQVADFPSSPAEAVSSVMTVPSPKDDASLPAEEKEVVADRKIGPRSSGPSLIVANNTFFSVWGSLNRPFVALFSMKATWADASRSLVCGLLVLAGWAFFGATITRTATLRLTQGERVGWGRMVQFCCARWIHYFFAPLCPLVPILLFALLMLPAGWLMRLGIGTIAVAIFWPIALLGGLVSAFLLLGVLFGWPLMWGTISTEGTDGFDAMSRSFSYVFQRPLQYLFYAIVAALFGGLCFFVVLLFASFVIELSTWAVSWGAGERLVGAMVSGDLGDLVGLQRVGVGILAFWIIGVKVVALSFSYSYFWVASSAIYLLLRRDTDAKELDEVFIEDGVSQVAAGLPDLTLNEADIPVTDEAASHQSTEPNT